MDNSIYVVNLTLTLDSWKKIPFDTTFPRFRLVLDPPTGVKSKADGWSVMIQIFEVSSTERAKAYLRLIFWERFPHKMDIGEKLVFRYGKSPIAYGEIIGIVDDLDLCHELLKGVTIDETTIASTKSTK